MSDNDDDGQQRNGDEATSGIAVEEDEETISTTSNNSNNGASFDNENEKESDDDANVPKNADNEDETSSEPEDEKTEGRTTLKRLSLPPSGLQRKVAKTRIKLSLRKLPTLANRKKKSPKNKKVLKITNDAASPDEDSDNGEIKATVVDGDEAGDDDDDAVATAVAVAAEQSIPTTTGKVVTEVKQSSAAKRRAPNPSRPLKLPPIASPGLLMTPSSNIPKTDIQKGYVTAASVFDHHMEQAGYTYESRRKRPHRGSSVKREVGDMFDTNVTLSLRFPPLVPPELLHDKVNICSEESGMQGGDAEVSLPELLIKSLTKKADTNSNCDGTNGTDSGSRKRNRLWTFSDMVPVSLTIPYPEDFIERRVKYIQDVDARERAIVAYQEAEEAVDIAKEQAAENESEENGASVLPAVVVPPIPEVPDPPHLEDLKWPDSDKFKKLHPLYPPSGKDNFVAHLDQNCFHITEGRYFGLHTNWIADANFVGPNAPGMNGLNASGGSGLATSTSGGGISGAMALTLSTTYNGTTAGASAALKSTTNTSTIKDISTNYNLDKDKADDSEYGPKPTGFAGDLKKIMEEEGDDLAASLKDCIIRAAVHASRSGRHGQSFMAPNGQIYPDVSKAFAAHAGIKPCKRCKSNKQGAYHCRLRRRHKEADFDGGNSPSILAPLFIMPIESLLVNKTSSN